MRKIAVLLGILVFVLAGIYAVSTMATLPPTYDGTKLDAAALYAQPGNYDTSGADGVSSIIVKETLDKTKAVNVVTAVLFDFRGYDTMGEAFILFTAISGCLVLLRKSTVKKEGSHERED